MTDSAVFLLAIQCLCDDPAHHMLLGGWSPIVFWFIAMAALVESRRLFVMGRVRPFFSVRTKRAARGPPRRKKESRRFFVVGRVRPSLLGANEEGRPRPTTKKEGEPSPIRGGRVSAPTA